MPEQRPISSLDSWEFSRNNCLCTCAKLDGWDAVVFEIRPTPSSGIPVGEVSGYDDENSPTLGD